MSPRTRRAAAAPLPLPPGPRGRSPATRDCASMSAQRAPRTPRPSRCTPATAPTPSSGPSSRRAVPCRRSASAWTSSEAALPTARRETCTPVITPVRRSSNRNPTESCTTRNRVSASTTRATGAPAPSSRSGPARIPPTRCGTCRNRTDRAGSHLPSPSRGNVTPGGCHSDRRASLLWSPSGVAVGTGEAGCEGVPLYVVQGRRVHQVTGDLVFTGQPGVAHGRVVGAERDADACRRQGRELVLGPAAGGAGLDVAGDRDLKGHAGGRQVLEESWVLGAADAVPDALRAEAKAVPDAARAVCLACVDGGREAGLAGE